MRLGIWFQQAQGRDRRLCSQGVALNDDERLEKEADLMGQASRSLNRPDSVHPRETGELNTNNNLIIQRTIDKDELKGKDRKNYNEISKKYYARFGLSAPDYQQIDSYNVKSFEQCCEEANSLVELAKLVDAQIVKADEARAKASAKSAGSTATMPVQRFNTCNMKRIAVPFLLQLCLARRQLCLARRPG